MRRDALFRRLLAVADLASATGGLAVIGSLTHHGIPLIGVVSIPLIVLVAKMLGRYDHDEVVLRKSTLDEIPALLTLAAAFTLTWSFVAYLAGIHTELRGGGVFVLWASISVLLILTRFAARQFAQLMAPMERALIVGDAGAPERFAHSLSSDPGTRIELAGMLPLEKLLPADADITATATATATATLRPRWPSRPQSRSTTSRTWCEDSISTAYSWYRPTLTPKPCSRRSGACSR